jgi:hypothetical protein
MSDSTVSRRTLALGLAGGVASVSLASVVSTATDGSAEEATSSPFEERRLLAPLVPGARLISWEIVAIEPLAQGAVRVALRGESGATFSVEVLARDASPLAPKPPAQTDKFALYVSNGGDGRTPTAEEQGLAAMALAQIVASNEAAVSNEGFLTHGGRIAQHRVALLEDVWAASNAARA